ncbi:hypothetical protein OXX80_000211 [Metschnikowia pulcherrima]
MKFRLTLFTVAHALLGLAMAIHEDVQSDQEKPIEDKTCKEYIAASIDGQMTICGTSVSEQAVSTPIPPVLPHRKRPHSWSGIPKSLAKSNKVSEEGPSKYKRVKSDTGPDPALLIEDSRDCESCVTSKRKRSDFDGTYGSNAGSEEYTQIVNLIHNLHSVFAHLATEKRTRGTNWILMRKAIENVARLSQIQFPNYDPDINRLKPEIEKLQRDSQFILTKNYLS